LLSWAADADAGELKPIAISIVSIVSIFSISVSSVLFFLRASNALFMHKTERQMTAKIRVLMMEDSWSGRVDMERRRPQKMLKSKRVVPEGGEEDEDEEKAQAEERVRTRRNSATPADKTDAKANAKTIRSTSANIKAVHLLQNKWTDTRKRFIRTEIWAGLATVVVDNFLQLLLQLYFIIASGELKSLLPRTLSSGRMGFNMGELTEEIPQLSSILMLVALFVNAVSGVVWMVNYDERFVASVFGSPDRMLLVQMFAELHGHTWTTKLNWLSSRDLDDWQGVTTDRDDRVVEIALSDNNISGRLSGMLAYFGALRSLWLDGNRFDGSLSGVAALEELPLLETCRIERNWLEGEIPVGALKMLVVDGILSLGAQDPRQSAGFTLPPHFRTLQQVPSEFRV
jgi:hypothetical protein